MVYGGFVVVVVFFSESHLLHYHLSSVQSVLLKISLVLVLSSDSTIQGLAFVSTLIQVKTKT